MCDPSRRPANDRVRVETSFDATVWIECTSCLGDGWHFAGHNFRPDLNRTARKERCTTCGGTGAIETLALYCGPNTRRVAPPAGSSSSESRS